MGTRSDIIARRKDGSWARIYCHWDGYLEHNGKLLFEHYQTQAKVEQLVELGDISSLGPEIGKEHPFDKPHRNKRSLARWEKLYGNMCLVYGRDRKEIGTEAKVGPTLHSVWPEEDCATEFAYVWDGERWFVGDPDKGTQTLVELGAALRGEASVTPNVKAFGVNLVVGKHLPLNPDAGDQPQHSWAWYHRSWEVA